MGWCIMSLYDRSFLDKVNQALFYLDCQFSKLKLGVFDEFFTLSLWLLSLFVIHVQPE